MNLHNSKRNLDHKVKWYKFYGSYPTFYFKKEKYTSLGSCAKLCFLHKCHSFDITKEECYVNTNYQPIKDSRGNIINIRLEEKSEHYEKMGVKFDETDKLVCTYRP